MHPSETVSRRAFLLTGGGLAAGAALWASGTLEAAPRLRVTGFELLPVRATERTVWLIVRLRTDAGLTGLGEASDAFGFANTTKQDAARMQSELRGFFGLIDGQLASGWRLVRVDAILRAILRAGAFELVEEADVPVRVVINEYVEVAHAFFAGDEPRVVNGVLDALARKLRPGALPER